MYCFLVAVPQKGKSNLLLVQITEFFRNEVIEVFCHNSTVLQLLNEYWVGEVFHYHQACLQHVGFNRPQIADS